MTNDKQRERLVELIQASVNGCARNWAEVIADYLLANGVIVPPCKVGDTLYVIEDGLWWEARVERIVMRRGTGVTPCIVFAIYRNGLHPIVEEDSFGKTVFLTKEEAEQALKGGAE